jgi:hypothetical protein
MKNPLLITLSFFLVICSYAQEYDSLAHYYSNTIKSTDIEKHLSILASDEFEGRATGKKGQKLAMEYLIEQFKSFGVEDYKAMNYRQEFALIEQANTGIAVVIDKDSFHVNQDFLFSPSITENQELNIQLAFIGYGIEDENYNDFDNIDVNNKLVFIWDEKPEGIELSREWTTKQKIENLKEHGALGVFVIDNKVESLLEKYHHYFTKPKMTLASDEVENFFFLRITEEMGEKILAQGGLKAKKIRKKGLSLKDKFEINLSLIINKPSEKLQGENVIAYIPGSEKKEELIVLTAHYDHLGMEDSVVYNGADDDGTGTSALIEIAEAFMQAKKDGFQNKRSILIMPVSGEEKGLLGSRYYTENPIFPLENTVANLNIDMIGRYDEAHKEDSNYVYLIGSDKLSQDLHELSEQVNTNYTNFNLDYTFNAEDDPNRFYYRSDHYNFAKNEVPVIFYFSGVHEDYHKASDTVEKIDFEKTAKIGRLVFLTAWHLANAEKRIQLSNKEHK